jgi:hypothetical protein
MIPSIFGGGHKEADALGRGRRDLATADTESSRGFGGRTQTSLSPTPGGPPADARLIPHDLIARLRSYHRLRALVLAYLRVQARREWLGRRLTGLQKAGKDPDLDFWEEFQGEFSGMGLRSDFPSRLLIGEDMIPELVDKVDQFDGRHAGVVTAAEAALNPTQSSKSAQEAGEHVRAMLKLGREIAEKCQEQTYTLLDELYETVTEIFAGEERTSPVEDLDQDGRFSNKQVSSAGETPDVSGHQLFSSKGAR